MLPENNVQVVITAGHPQSAYHLVHRVLESAGIQAAQRSRREGLTPEALEERILGAHGVNLQVPAKLGQLSPGNLWRDLAVDLFLGNLGTGNWGWADARAIWLLDFWLRFDEQTRFVLVYCSPTLAIANMVTHGGAEMEPLASAMNSWMRWNSELLRFSSRHPSRCLLVNSAAAMRYPSALVASANELLRIHLAEPPPADGDVGSSALVSLLTNGLVDEFSEAFALYDELESAAHLQDGQVSVTPSLMQPAWEEYLGTVSRVEKLRIDLVEERARHHRVELALQEAATARVVSAKELDEVRASLESTYQAMTFSDEREDQLTTRNSSLIKENELLFLQLKQLQEALEQTTSANADSQRHCLELAAQAAAVDAARAKGQLGEVALDMRREIDGTNWYWAEHDGRWAGPGKYGTLRLPAMGPGRYELNLEVVGAMDPEIVAGMQVTLCGVPLALTREGRKYPAVLKGVVTLEQDTAPGDWSVGFEFPKLLSPAQRGSTDRRELAIRLRTVRLRAVQNGSGKSSVTD